MGWHWRGPSDLDSALARDRYPARPDHQVRGTPQIVGCGVKNPFAEGAGKLLFGAEQDEAALRARGPRRHHPIRCQQPQRLADRVRNDLGVRLDAGKQRSALLRARCSDPTHCGDHRLQLADVLDLGDDICEPLGHHDASGSVVGRGPSCTTSARSAAFSSALLAPSRRPVVMIMSTAGIAPRSSQAGSSARSLAIASVGRRSSSPPCMRPKGPCEQDAGERQGCHEAPGHDDRSGNRHRSKGEERFGDQRQFDHDRAPSRTTGILAAWIPAPLASSANAPK